MKSCVCLCHFIILRNIDHFKIGFPVYSIQFLLGNSVQYYVLRAYYRYKRRIKMRFRQLTLVAVNQQVGPLTRITRPPSITLQRQIRRDVVVALLGPHKERASRRQEERWKL